MSAVFRLHVYSKQPGSASFKTCTRCIAGMDIKVVLLLLNPFNAQDQFMVLRQFRRKVFQCRYYNLLLFMITMRSQTARTSGECGDKMTVWF